jgi:MFS family permease
MADLSVGLLRRHRAFRGYWLGQSLSFVGTQVTAVALPLVAALMLSAGPGQVGAIATAGMLPNLLFSLLVGHWVEGREHRRIMIPADIARAVLLAVIPVAALGDWLSIPVLVIVAFLTGVAGVCFEIAGFAYVPSVVDSNDLPAANRAVQGSSTVAEVAGPGLAGLLVQAVGPALAIVVDALSYVASAIGIAVGGSGKTAVLPSDHVRLDSDRQRLRRCPRRDCRHTCWRRSRHDWAGPLRPADAHPTHPPTAYRRRSAISQRSAGSVSMIRINASRSWATRSAPTAVSSHRSKSAMTRWPTSIASQPRAVRRICLARRSVASGAIET